MSSSPFASIARDLLAQGYSPVPIMPGEKKPGEFKDGRWRPMSGWSQYCERQPSEHENAAWESWPDAGVGVALGRGVIAIDADRNELTGPLLEVLPPPVVGKYGRKGATWFYRADTDAIRSRGFKDAEGKSLLDVISGGKQTVLPPSGHPETGRPYEWLDPERTLANTPPSDLTEVTAEHFAAVLDVLRAHGWEEQKPLPVAERSADGDALDGLAWYRDLNNEALGNLGAWVPHLGLTQLIRSGAGYKAVATWRASSTGRPLERRGQNLSIKPNGIVDFGDGEKGYTPLNLVMAAKSWDQERLSDASRWLGERLGRDFSPLVITSGGKRTETERVHFKRVNGHCINLETGKVVQTVEDMFRAIGCAEDEIARLTAKPDDGALCSDVPSFEELKNEPLSQTELEEIARDNIIVFPCPKEVRHALSEREMLPLKDETLAWCIYMAARIGATRLIDDALAYCAERKGRPLKIDDDEREEFVDEIALYVAFAVQPPIRIKEGDEGDEGFRKLSAAFLASPGFARFKAAVHAFYNDDDDIGVGVGDGSAAGGVANTIAPYPVSMLGPILSAAAEAIAEEIQVPLPMAANAILGVASLAAQGVADVRLPKPDQRRPLSLFALTIADSGDRKSSADREAMAPVREYEGELAVSYADECRRHKVRLRAWQAEQNKIMRNGKIGMEERISRLDGIGIEPVPPTLPNLTIAECTSEGLAKHAPRLQPALGIFSDEGAQFLNGHSLTADTRRATIGFYCSVWDGNGIPPRLRAGADPAGGYDHFRLALHLQTQPSVATAALYDPDMRGQGLHARFLIAAPPSLAGTRMARDSRPGWRQAINRYRTQALGVFRAHARPDADGAVVRGELVVDEEALSVFVAFYNRVEAAQVAGGRLEAIKDVASKAAEQATRIAGVLTVFHKPQAKEIDSDTMRKACTIMDWYLGEAVRVFVKAKEEATATESDVLRKWIVEKGFTEVTSREIARSGPALIRKAPVRKNAIETLEVAGYLIRRGASKWKVSA